MKPLRRTCILLSLLTVLAACGGSGSGAALWIAAPVNDLELPPGQPVHLEGHVRNSGDVSAVEVWADDSLLTTLTDFVPLGELLYFETSWTPPGTGDVILTAIARAGEVTLGEDSVRLHIRAQAAEAPIDAPLAGITPPGTTLEDITPEPEPVLCEPSVTALMNANCRSGPEGVFSVLGYLLEGETAAIAAQLADSSWWLIPNPDRPGECWIASNVVEAQCLGDAIPVVAKPPTPTPADDKAPPVPAPAYPIGGQSLACVYTLTLAWHPVTDESGIAAHQVEMERSADNSSWTAMSDSPWTAGDGNKLTISLQCGWYHRWRVRAQDNAGNWSEFSPWAYFVNPIQ